MATKEQLAQMTPQQRADYEKIKARVRSVVEAHGEAKGTQALHNALGFMWDEVGKFLASALVQPNDDQVWAKVQGSIAGTVAMESVVFEVIGVPEDEPGDEEAPPAAPPPADDVFGG